VCSLPCAPPAPPARSLLQADGVWAKWVAQRYATFDSGIGKKIEARGGGGGIQGPRVLLRPPEREPAHPADRSAPLPPPSSRCVACRCGVCAQDGRTSYAELERYVLDNGEAKRTSGKQEKFEALFNDYV
jgi:hypothetical protein